MHDVVEMTVVNASKDLLGQNSGITLAELSSLENFVEKFTSLADSKKKFLFRKRSTYSVTR